MKLIAIFAVLLGLATTLPAADYSTEAAALAIRIKNQGAKVTAPTNTTPWIINRADPFSPGNQVPQGMVQVCGPNGCRYVPAQQGLPSQQMVQVCGPNGCYYVPAQQTVSYAPDSESYTVVSNTGSYMVNESQLYEMQGTRFIPARRMASGASGNQSVIRGPFPLVRRVLFWRNR